MNEHSKEYSQGKNEEDNIDYKLHLLENWF